MSENAPHNRARQRLAEEQRRSSAHDKAVKVVRNVITVIGGLVIIGLIVWGFIAVRGVSQNARQQQQLNDRQTVQLTPKNVGSDGSFLIRTAKTSDSSTRVDNFFDPMCPGCGIVDRAISKTMTQQVDSGDIALHLRPVSFLDKSSTDQYSTRAINAFITINQYNPRISLDFMSGLYKNGFQPSESTAYKSVSDDEFVKLAESLNVPKNEAEKIKDHHYTKWIEKNSTTQMNNKQLFPDSFSTPSIFVGLKFDGDKKVAGDKVKFSTDGDFDTTYINAVKAAQK